MRLGLALILGLALVAGCVRPVESNYTVRAWLNAHAGAPSVNVEGHWLAPDWGTTYLRQCSNRISGKIGAYTVYGSVYGAAIHLALYYGGALYYTAKLHMQQPGTLLGKYYRTTRQEYGWAMMITRPSNPR